jgi:exopolysaccharide biosynthesis polyprenyl glycosylphosphotransferase
MTTQLGRLTAGLASKVNFAVDLLVMGAAMAGASVLGGGAKDKGLALVSLFLIAVGVWTVLATALRHYDPSASRREPAEDAALTSVLILSAAILLAFGSVLLPGRAPPVALFLLLDWPAVLVLRAVFRVAAAREVDPYDDVLIVGTGALARLTAKDVVLRGRRRVLGFLRLDGAPLELDVELRRALSEDIDIFGNSSELERVLRAMPAGEVYLAADARQHAEQVQACVKICERLGVPFALPAHSYRLERARLLGTRADFDGYLHYLSIDARPHQLALKRLFDVVAAAVALWILLPLFLAVAAAIKLTSRGPVFFKQRRIGLHGEAFEILKFRSMVENAEELRAELASENEQAGPVFKMKRDPRVTAVGRFIRKYSIDEMPQLINVLRGEMSMVGPRPPLPHEVAKYEAWQLRRLSVRPGLTCIWQVSGRNQISFDEWMYLDLRYIDTWSLAQDLQLIARTVPVVVTGRGAS